MGVPISKCIPLNFLVLFYLLYVFKIPQAEGKKFVPLATFCILIMINLNDRYWYLHDEHIWSQEQIRHTYKEWPKEKSQVLCKMASTGFLEFKRNQSCDITASKIESKWDPQGILEACQMPFLPSQKSGRISFALFARNQFFSSFIQNLCPIYQEPKKNNPIRIHATSLMDCTKFRLIH